MKILKVIPYFYPAISLGGSTSAVHDISKFLVRKGHEITIFTTDIFNSSKRVDYPQDKRVNIDGLKVYYFKNISNSLAFSSHLFIPLNFFHTLSRDIGRYDIVHLHEIYTLMHLWAGFMARKNKIPYIVSPHGTTMMMKEEGRIVRKKLFYLLGGKRLFEEASFLIALTPDEKKSFMKFGIKEDKIKIIPNGINLEDFSSLSEGDKFRRKYHIKKNTSLLLFLGRIHPKKGIDLLIRAVSILKKSYNDLVLLIAGPKEDKNYFKKLKKMIKDLNIEKEVIITDVLISREKLLAFSTADLFVLTSYAEGLPLSVLEAAASRLPLLISKNCGLPEVEKYNAGKIVRADVDDIVFAIEKIISRRNFRKYYGNGARKMVEEKFNLETVGTCMEKLYEDIISDS